MNLFNRKSVIVGLVAVAYCVGPVTAARAADPDSAAVAKAKKLIQTNEKVFAGFAHPTPTLIDVEYGTAVNAGFGGGFKITCKFNYKDGIPDRFWSKLEIEFSKGGDYVGVRSGGSTGLIGPFAAGQSIISAFKTELLKDPELAKVPGLAEAVRQADVYGLLKACLKRPN